VFKGCIIECGFYITVAILSTVLQRWMGVTVFQFWSLIILGVLYGISVRLIYAIAWPKE